MAATGRGLKSAEVFAAIKSVKNHEVQLRNRSEIPINAVVSPSNERIDSRRVSTVDIDYVNDTLQVTVQKICNAIISCRLKLVHMLYLVS